MDDWDLVDTVVSGVQNIALADGNNVGARLAELCERMTSLPLPLCQTTDELLRSIALRTAVRLSSLLTSGQHQPGLWRLIEELACVQNDWRVSFVAILRRIRVLRDLSFTSSSPADPRMYAILGSIHNTEGRRLSVHDLSIQLQISPSSVSRLIRRTTGQTYATVARAIKTRRAQALLIEGQLSVKEIASTLGYPCTSSLDRDFHRETGKSPSSWQREWIEGWRG